jgi:autotransporter-associated beta strand protein
MAGTLSVAAIAGTGGITVSNGAALLVNGTTSNSLRAAVGVINNGTIVLNAAQTFSSLAGVGQLTLGGNLAVSQGSYSGNLSDGGVGYTLTKNSSGTLTLSGNDNFMGGTTINAGTLVIDTGGSYSTGDAQTTGSLTVANSASFTATSLLAPGELTNNGDAFGNVTLASGGTLAGTGNIHGTLNMANGSTYAPGNSPGMQTVDHDVTWGNMTYQMQIADVAGAQGVGYDSLSVTGSLNIVGTNIAVNVDSYPPNSQAVHFSNGSPFDLILVSTTNGIENFVGSNFHVDSSLFEMANNLGGGAFSVILSPDGDDLFLHFTSAVPEPATLALFSLSAAALGYGLRRKRITAED